jgi:hypothetical protein
LFTHPGIRRWISFTAEPAFAGSLCLVVGIAAKEAPSELQPMLRPLSKKGSLTGHFHAAAFPYQPLKKGRIDLTATVDALFARESVQGLLHLLPDEREASGAGESEFVRGACWAGPITKVEGA